MTPEDRMFKNKLFNIAVIILIAIALLGIAGVVVYKMYINPAHANVKEKAEELPIDEVLKLSVETEEITTNLQDGGYAKVRFRLQAEDEDTKEELVKRLFQVDHIIIKTLAGMSSEELKGAQGIAKMEGQIKDGINEYLQLGETTEVLTTRLIIQ